MIGMSNDAATIKVINRRINNAIHELNQAIELAEQFSDLDLKTELLTTLATVRILEHSASNYKV